MDTCIWLLVSIEVESEYLSIYIQIEGFMYVMIGSNNNMITDAVDI